MIFLKRSFLRFSSWIRVLPNRRHHSNGRHHLEDCPAVDCYPQCSVSQAVKEIAKEVIGTEEKVDEDDITDIDPH